MTISHNVLINRNFPTEQVIKYGYDVYTENINNATQRITILQKGKEITPEEAFLLGKYVHSLTNK